MREDAVSPADTTAAKRCELDRFAYGQRRGTEIGGNVRAQSNMRAVEPEGPTQRAVHPDRQVSQS